MKSMPCGACSFLQVDCPDNCFWASLIKPGEEEKFSVLIANTSVDSLKKRVIRNKKKDRQKFIDNQYKKEKMKCEPKAFLAQTVGPSENVEAFLAQTVGPSENVGHVTENTDDPLLLLARSAEILPQEILGNENTGKPPSSHHAGSSSSSFTKTYPHFPAWKYNVMNPDGTFSSKPLTRVEHVPNVPWPDPVNVDLVEESMQMIVGLQSLVCTLSCQYVINDLNWAHRMEIADATRRTLEERIKSLESENRQYDPRFLASQEGNIEGSSSRKKARGPNDA